MKSNDNDLLRNLCIGAIASLPYVGGTLAYIMDKNVSSQVEQRYYSFVNSLENDINSIKKDIDYSRFETPQFYSMFVKVINEVISNHLEEKKTAYKNILINTLDSSLNCNKNDFFFSITTHLSLDSINYLYLIYSDYAQLYCENISIALSDLMKHFETQSDYLITVVSELVRYNLISGKKLTKLGNQYCDFIFSPISIQHINSNH